MKPKNRSTERLETRILLAADLGYSADDLLPPISEAGEDPPAQVGQEDPSAINGGSLTGAEDSLQATDVVLDWNNLFNDLLVADEVNQNPGYASRAMAMMNLGIYDAVTLAKGDPENTFYNYEIDLGPYSHLSAEVAASEAAYTVLSALYSDHQEMIDAFYDQALAAYPPMEVKAASSLLGAEIGATVVAARANDGADAVVGYTYQDGIGSFQADPLNPDVPVWGPAWGEVETFSISAPESYAPETTPPITSAEYAASYNEVKELGSVDSETRTADQTEAGIFWAYDRVGMGTPMSLFSDALEAIALGQGNTMEQNAALFAQASVAMADAGIVAWHTKFDEEFWRPVTAIHAGDIDGNESTEGDPDWTALGAPDGGADIVGFTPQFPTYISGHATFGAALFGAIREFYGTDDIAFELTSKELEVLLADPELQAAYGLSLDDATRSFDSLSEAMAENGRSRVYLGIHFDFDDLVGQEVGQAVASAVSSDFVVAEDDRSCEGKPRGTGQGGQPGNFPGRPRGPRRPRGIELLPLEDVPDPLDLGRAPRGAENLPPGPDGESRLGGKRPTRFRGMPSPHRAPEQPIDAGDPTIEETPPAPTNRGTIQLDFPSDQETLPTEDAPPHPSGAADQSVDLEATATPEESESLRRSRDRNLRRTNPIEALDDAFSDLGDPEITKPPAPQRFAGRNQGRRRA